MAHVANDAVAKKIVNDTVEQAQQNPDQEQPYAALGLKDDEYARIKEILGRRPTDAELTMYSVMWSEHCSYKSSKAHLRYFGETMTEQMAEKILAGIGENAGVVDIGDGNAVTFRVESHNHPSYVEPYQGAATGVGGIVRDIMAMGARPIAVMDQLRFGPAEAPDTSRVLPGVVHGIGGYGNSLGLPNIGGETVFDESYAANPLVNALCVGTLKVEDLKLAFASGKGNKVMLFGSRTGLDGIGGVSVLASESFDEGAERKLPAVQVGDPFAEKVLIECCLELYHAGTVVGIQDLGGAGLACATSELAAAGDGGMEVNLDAVPLRAENMTAAEILASESQERMCAVVAPENVERFREICAKWDVTCAEIGEVVDGKHLVIRHGGEVVVDAPAYTMADEGPVYERPYARPEWQDELQQFRGVDKPVGADLLAAWKKMLASPALCSRDFITEQYDRYVRGNTVDALHSDAGVLRIDEETYRGVAVSADCSGRYTKLDPNMGARLALAEAYRNVAAKGATPVAITNCLNFGSPENTDVMWQFREAVHGLADGAVELKLPVSGGNVSFYNQTGEEPILPTPVVGVLGVFEDVRKAIGHRPEAGQKLVLLGETKEEFGGSIWQQVTGAGLNGLPPQVDLANEERLAAVLSAGEATGITAAHDLSEGGLGQSLAEMCFDGGVGAKVDLSAVHADATTAMFSESASRILVATNDVEATLAAAKKAGVPAAEIGATTEEQTLQVAEGVAVSVAELREVWAATLPGLFGNATGANSVLD
ncbi:phosphoribosylformylglycinamidine synthase subunit PurL [Corynebacterium pseudodiphtheriticum]|uniref:phosphoribosylformylglycinamidine synthase subunit PurL n=1 Tax=Corynebacterium pseudodiphtheriticum TaxID=37637 RepID=UPI0025515646|nr:phosphoribosylformylglycinamidine synthase subunit PurL [Corynebacterium pseudodiphtheriticum]MDK8563986.1 phosphoribosylformylglycinamidine synthase subunit PurL [Corynebacterium pseudodiphtheriticum]MDK8614284.1 phosphoribosylformylglycinamidine synthase subunit PurL [Corynebacterium pseudodiphtheriticum]MDK8738222.1 phosphoribosylformylglycinamidine synthase subunit PurL [Corynebacterium pseudodiphtheriticum]MDK8744770.1 phosphoribosylformylglycinamidine synthase subunit PurL [Corynebacte